MSSFQNPTRAGQKTSEKAEKRARADLQPVALAGEVVKPAGGHQ